MFWRIGSLVTGEHEVGSGFAMGRLHVVFQSRATRIQDRAYTHVEA